MILIAAALPDVGSLLKQINTSPSTQNAAKDLANAMFSLSVRSSFLSGGKASNTT
jgi:hypothetical protein